MYDMMVYATGLIYVAVGLYMIAESFPECPCATSQCVRRSAVIEPYSSYLAYSKNLYSITFYGLIFMASLSIYWSDGIGRLMFEKAVCHKMQNETELCSRTGSC